MRSEKCFYLDLPTLTASLVESVISWYSSWFLIKNASISNFLCLAKESSPWKHLCRVSLEHSGLCMLDSKVSLIKHFTRKRQMVRRIKPHHMRQMEEDIIREKQNIFFCMNPAATVVSKSQIVLRSEKSFINSLLNTDLKI